MNTQEQLQTESNLQTLENEVALTTQEKESFKKLPKEEQKKRNEEKLAELTSLNSKHTEIIKEATETGDQKKLEEAKDIKKQIELGIKDLEQQVSISEVIPTPRDLEIFEEIRNGNFDNTDSLTTINPEISEILNDWILKNPMISLNLRSLTSAEGLVLPESFGGELYLNGLISAKGLILPESIGGWIGLSGLTSAEGLILPKSIKGSLDLSGLTSAEGLVLPDRITVYLMLSKLTTTEIDELRKKYPQFMIL